MLSYYQSISLNKVTKLTHFSHDAVFFYWEINELRLPHAEKTYTWLLQVQWNAQWSDWPQKSSKKSLEHMNTAGGVGSKLGKGTLFLIFGPF